MYYRINGERLRRKLYGLNKEEFHLSSGGPSMKITDYLQEAIYNQKSDEITLPINVVEDIIKSIEYREKIIQNCMEAKIKYDMILKLIKVDVSNNDHLESVNNKTILNRMNESDNIGEKDERTS
jgi:hypothetical protein